MKRQRLVIALALGALVVSLVACGDDDDADVEPTEQTEAFFAQASDYESWETLGDGERMNSADHAGHDVITYANASALATIEAEDYPFDGDAILVKEQYADDGDTPTVLSLMAKESADADWYWMQATPDWELANGVQGTDVEMCAGCHGGASGTGGVFVGAYPDDHDHENQNTHENQNNGE